MTGSWWRRNRVALPAMVVALGALAWPLSEPARDVWWDRQPHVARAPGPDGWAALGGARLRLAAFNRVDDVPIDELSAGLVVWRAELDADAAGEPRLCEAELLDTEGRRYSAGSSYLPSFDDMAYGVECGGGEDPGGVAYFLIPAEAEPAAVEVTALDLMPQYWALPTP